MQETQVQSLGWEDPLEKEMATHSNNLAWKNLMDTGAWWAAVHRVAKSGMTEWLTLTYLLTDFGSCLFVIICLEVFSDFLLKSSLTHFFFSIAHYLIYTCLCFSHFSS